MIDEANARNFLLLAPPGGGKTRFCLQKIEQTLAEAPFAPVWVIVRDRLQAAAYRRLLEESGLALGVEVATFGDLYEEVLARSESGFPVGEEPALRALLHAVVEQVDAAGGLAHFARIRALPGFVATLRERFAELKNAMILPERLAAAAQAQADESSAAALAEIARLYAAYQQALQRQGWADQEGVTWLGLEALQAGPHLLRDLRLVMVDGFDSFNPAQRQTLQALAGRVQELWITLPGAAAMDRPAHRRFARAFHELQAQIPLQVVELPANPHRLAEFAQFEARLFAPPQPPLPPTQRIELLEAQSPDEEAREALRWLKARILRDGFAPAECALIVPDFAAYRAAILAAGAAFGIPLRLTRAGRLIDTPPVAALLDLLFLPARNYPLRLLLDTIRAPFFDFSADGLRREDAKLLEIVSRRGQVVEGLPPWYEVLGALAQQQPPVPAAESAPAEDPLDGLADGEEAAYAPTLPKGEAAARLERGLRSLAARITPPPGAQPLEEWIRWLAGRLEEVRFAQNGFAQNGFAQDGIAQPGAGAESRWLDAFRRLLGSLARSERLAGKRSLGYADFLAELQSLLAGAPALDDAPDGAERLLVLHTYEARGLRFRAAALVGLAEGVFPSVERADPFLDEAVRAALGMEPRLGQDQPGIFYQMIARAEERLLLTRPYLAKDGEGWEPSPFWPAAQEVLGERVTRVRPEDNRPLCDAASTEELVFWAARRAALNGSPLDEPFAAPAQARYRALQDAHRVLAARLAGLDAAPHHGGLSEVADGLGERFGAQAVWSASRLESYATCPFAFFAGSALGLEPIRAPKAGFETFQLGSLLHEALELAYRDCPEPENVEAVLARLPEVAGRVFAAAPQKYAFRPTLLWEVQQAELLEALRQTVIALAALDAESGWQPVAFECRFGFAGAPFLEILVDGQAVRLHGVIDRVDRDRRGRLRVIDYKSGGAHLAAQDLLDGRRLQLPLYALAVEQALGLGQVAEGLYWKLFAQEPGALRLSRFQSEQGDGPPAAYRLAEQHIQRLVSGIRQGAFSPQPPEGGCPSYCPAASWCWSYRARAVF